jgi:hypothetical protein
MGILDWLREFNPIRVYNNVTIEQACGSRSVSYIEGDRHIPLHADPNAVRLLKQAEITPELETIINEASTASLKSLEPSLNLLSDSTQQEVVIATVLNASLDAIRNE